MSNEQTTRCVYQEWYKNNEGWYTPGWRFDGIDEPHASEPHVGNFIRDHNKDGQWKVVETTEFAEGRPIRGFARFFPHYQPSTTPGDPQIHVSRDKDTGKLTGSVDPAYVKGVTLDGSHLVQYQKLTSFQKRVVDALLAMGFTWKYNDTYQCPGWSDIHVGKFSRWSDVLQRIHEDGKDQKRFEIARVLGIT